MTCKCTSTKKAVAGLVVGVLLVITGIVLGPITDLIVHRQVKEKLVLKPGTTFYGMWKDAPFPIYQQFYFFSVENPVEIRNGGKPNLTQRGPYTYREYRIKDNITFDDDGLYVNYTQKKHFVFVRDMSVGDEFEYFVSPNAILPTISQLLKYESDSSPIKALTNLLAKAFAESLFHNKTVYEMLWGYHDHLLAAAHKLAPRWFYTDVVGYMAGKNNSYDGQYQIRTGKDDINDLGKIDLFNGSRFLNFWTSIYSNMVNGTDGSLHHPFTKKTSILYTFVPDICRSIKGVYKRERSVRGIGLYEFIAPKSLFANKTVNPNNAGFCTPADDCLGTGVLNISSCQLFNYIHLPVIVSNPHFLNADPKYLNAINGLHPNPAEHNTLIDIEPMTGLSLRVNKRLQINLSIKRDANFDELKNVTDVIFPIVWANETATVDEKTADKLDDMLFKPMRIARILRYTIIAVGCVIIVAAVVYALIKRKRMITIRNTTVESDPILRDIVT